MSLSTFKKAISNATRIMESAATTVALTNQMNEPTTFVIPSQGINVGQLKQLFISKVSPATEIIEAGDSIRISTNNPTAATRVLKEMGISSTVDGEILNNTHT